MIFWQIVFKFFDPNSECIAKYVEFCSHIFNYACVRRKVYRSIVLCTKRFFLLKGRVKKGRGMAQCFHCFHWKYRTAKKKGISCTSLDVQFSTASISDEKKKSSFFVMGLPIFSEALVFSLLCLWVNPALCLQSIFSLTTCDMSNLCGLQIQSSCF